MFSKIKMSFWDFFVHFLTGILCIILIFGTLLYKGVLSFDIFKDFPLWVSGVGFVVALWLLGLLIEPLSNLLGKVTWSWPAVQRNFSLREWDRSIKNLRIEAEAFIPNGAKENSFQYAKNFLIVNESAEDYNVFLSRFGFYRNCATIFLLFGIIAFFSFAYPLNLQIGFSSILLSAMYCYRSKIFYRHISITVFSQFIALHKKK